MNTNGNVHYSNVHYIFHIFSVVEHDQKLDLQILSHLEVWRYFILWIPVFINIPDNKVHGANMGPIWGRQDPGGPHVGPMNFAIWDIV